METYLTCMPRTQHWAPGDRRVTAKGALPAPTPPTHIDGRGRAKESRSAQPRVTLDDPRDEADGEGKRPAMRRAFSPSVARHWDRGGQKGRNHHVTDEGLWRQERAAGGRREEEAGEMKKYWW